MSGPSAQLPPTAKLIGASFALTLACVMVACGERPNEGYAPLAATPALTKEEAAKVPTSVKLVRTTLVPSSEEKNEVYRIVEASFGADDATHIISAEISVVSAGGTEVIKLAGKIRENGSATLLDLSPIPDKNDVKAKAKQRLVAEGYCVDHNLGSCQKIILNVWYKIGKESRKRQFVSEELEKSSGGEEPLPGVSGKDKAASTPDSGAVDEEEQPQADGKSNPYFDHGSDDAVEDNEPEPEWGEFVGSPRNEEYINQLLERPLVPEAVPGAVEDTEETKKVEVEKKTEIFGPPWDPSRAKPKLEPIDAGVEATGKNAIPSPRPMSPSEIKAAADAAAADVAAKKAKAEMDAAKQNAAAAARLEAEARAKAEAALKAKETSTPPKSPKTGRVVNKAQLEEAAKVRADAAEKARTDAVKAKLRVDLAAQAEELAKAKSAAAEKAKAEALAKLKAESDARKKAEAAEKAKAAAKEKSQDDNQAEKAKAAAEAEAKRLAGQSRMKQIEAKLSPYLDLSGGGKASGFYSQGGRLREASALPESGHGFARIYKERTAFYGTGMMISLITKLAAVFTDKYFPGTTIYFGDISQKSGGQLIGTRHRSHQNGLDADIAFIGNKNFTTEIKGGVIDSQFEFSKNWQFWRLVASQQIVQDNQRVSALVQIYVNPVIKKGICSWAKRNDLLSNPFDKELMRRLRSWSGHDKHFHLRIRCSPYYPDCRNQGDPAPGTGC